MKRREFITGVVAGAAAGVACNQGQPSRIPEFARLSFAQQGEDIILFHALRDLLKVERASYLDVGAAHPVSSNNTYLLYTTGARGVLVEPNPMYVAMIRDKRPDDVVVAAGIGVTDTDEADYFEIKGNPLLNTFSPAQVEELQKGKTESVVERVSKMPLININRVIQEHLGKAPDLLSTDIEGMDLDIIRSLDLTRFRPGVICCEGQSFYNTGYSSYIAQHLIPQGYVPRGGSMVNSVFVDGRRIEI